MKKRKVNLGVNIDHIATLRNVRNDGYIDLIEISKILRSLSVNSLTVHLREDRRHILDEDVISLKKSNVLPINLEMAPTHFMKNFCFKLEPFACCIVPEKREEITTEGGLNVKKNYKILKTIIDKLKKKKIRISLFIEPNIKDIKIAKKLGSDAVELHTGKFSRLFLKTGEDKEFIKLKKAAAFASEIGLECHAGHGLNYQNIKKIISISEIVELNIGYFIVAESVKFGIKKVIQDLQKIIYKD